MTAERFYVAESNLIDGYCVFDREKKYAFHPKPRKADCLNDAHILNELSDENRRLKQQLRIFSDGLKSEIRETKEVFEDYFECVDEKLKLKKENEQLKRDNELLSDELEQCKAVIDNRWKEYLDKKGDVE